MLVLVRAVGIAGVVLVVVLVVVLAVVLVVGRFRSSASASLV